jgi:type IV secretion system protein VirD4
MIRVIRRLLLRPLRRIFRHLWMLGCRAMLLLALGIIAANCFLVGVTFPWVGVAAVVAATWRRLRRGWKGTCNFGSARYATLVDVVRGNLTGDNGWIMGRLGYVPPPTRGQALRWLLNPLAASEDACRLFFAACCGSRWGGNGFIRINDGVHGAVFAPAGAGKTTRVLGPNLLSYAGNCVVVDPKGELFELTAGHRRRHFGHTVVRLDPALRCGTKANCFNPFDFIDPRADDFIDLCRDLANMLVVRTGKETEAFWADAAETLIAAFSAHVCAGEPKKELRNLRALRTLIASRQNYAFALEAMQNNEDFHGVLQQLGLQLGWHVDRQLAGVMANAQRHTDIFDSPLIVDSTGGTDWDPAELRTGRMTVYVIVPGDKLIVWAGWTRMVLGSILRIITRGRPTEKNPVLFLVDEAAHIGRMQAMEDGITLMRGMGIRMWLCFQSIDQLNRCFGDHASTVLDNLGTQLNFGINSYEHADAISKRIGDFTLDNTTTGSNSGSSWSTGVKSDGGSRNTGSNYSTTEMGRRLLKPEEILTLGRSVGVLFHKNHPVMCVQLIEYFRDRAFRWRWWRCGYGTGRSPGLGLGGMVMGLIALALSGLVTVLVARLPVPVRQRPGAVAPGEFYPYGPVEPWRQPVFQPSPFGPGQRQPGWRPLPYRRQRRFYP